ncbi:MAG: 23S rRNA (pseudouridine(1915)-N(3))-methyltransferase RlmH [Turicibacter sp.]|nr:23S rRNA (pseudouridine(1915)-N(3))-methyltransferase RlmH [Turicibacter sp.]
MIKIICVGKIKEKFFREAISEYEKRLTKYTKLQIIEIPDESDPSAEVCMKKESTNILKNIAEKDFVITLEIEGKKMNSVDLARKIDSLLINNPSIAFVIGGSYGLDKSVKERSNFALSFSDFTFPHQMFRVVLLEQIYRSFKIINNESYHK